MNTFAMMCILVLWIIGTFILFLIIYIEFGREKLSVFRGKYFRDFPSDLNPEIVGYLLRGRITTNDLSASILNLIYKKKISCEKIEKDYKFTLLENEATTSLAEEEVIALLFDGETEVYMSKFKEKASEGYERFVNIYHNWRSAALEEALHQEFFVQIGFIKKFATIYSVLGVILSIVSFFYFSLPVLSSITFLICLFLLFYLHLCPKRTFYGNDEYYKWLGLKRFIKHFGSFEEKDLPEMKLWEKYMVYATTFGVAKKLSKQMKLRMGNGSFDSSFSCIEPLFLEDMISLGSVLVTDLVSIHSAAIITLALIGQISSSSDLSSKGGSFGGGGGGHRF